MPSWEEARRRSRQLEKDLERKIEELRSLNANLSHDSGGYDQESASFPNEQKIINAIEDLFGVLEQSINDMDKYAMEHSKSQQVNRYRQIIQENHMEYQRIARSLRAKRESAELFSDMLDKPRENGDTEHLLRERKGLESGLRVADMLLDQADSTKKELENQRNTFEATGQRLLSGVVSIFPVLGSWIEKVKRRKQRDQLILAAVIAILLLFLFWYVFKR